MLQETLLAFPLAFKHWVMCATGSPVFVLVGARNGSGQCEAGQSSQEYILLLSWSGGAYDAQGTPAGFKSSCNSPG